MNNAARKQKRFFAIIALMIAGGAAATLILSALNDNIVFFLTPSEIAEKHFITPLQRLRLGGMVEQGSIKRDGNVVHFVVTDGKKKLDVTYAGPLPDLFREGQGVVAEGRLQGFLFAADTVLAKHDERYMPREVADALKKQGYWQTHAPAPEAPPK